MTDLTTSVASLLHVASNTSPFNGAHGLYSKVKFKRGYPLGSMETPTVALHPTGGMNAVQGLGTVDQWRFPTVRCEILTETEMDAKAIIEKLRQAWQRDYNCEAGGVVGTVGTGYLRETGEIKYIRFNEAQRGPWDDAGQVVRFFFDLTLEIGD
jgi:hypothetical protein